MLSRLKRLLVRSPRAYLWARRARILLRYAARRPHEPDFAAFASFPDRSGLFLDVGANAGQSALSFRVFNRKAPILSIEPNRFHAGDLRLLKRLIRRFDYMILGAGDENTVATLHVPVYDGVPLTGDASLSPEAGLHSWWMSRQGADHPDRLRVEAVSIVVRKLDDLNLAPSFVKVDVEGSELAVVRGLIETIREHRPILLVECSVGHDELQELLARMDYAAFVYDQGANAFRDFVGQKVLNVFYLPLEEASRLPAAASSP